MKKSLFFATIAILMSILCTSCSNDSVIYYITNDGKKIEMDRSAFDAIVISHKYVDGVGSIRFINKLTQINKQAFTNRDRLTSVTIPDSVTEIGRYAFYNCTSLTSITIPNSVTSIGESAFAGCTSLTNAVIGNGVTSIGGSAFAGCTLLTSLTIPNSVTSIGGSALKGCTSLTNAVIGNGVTSIGDYAFAGCTSLKRVDISDLSAWCKISFAYDANPLYYGAHLYLNGSELTDITIPSDITEIKDNAFSNYAPLTSITIPESITKIGKYAFYNCTGELTINCNIPSASSSSKGAFYGSKFTKVTIGDSVTSIGDSAFAGCTSVTKVVILDSVTSIGDSAFAGCTSLTSITIPNSVTSIGDSAFAGCTSVTKVVIPDSVTSIGHMAFSGCAGELIIDSKAFSGDLGGAFEKVTTGDNITAIFGSEFFEDRYLLKELVVKNADAKIYRSVLEKCRLSSIMIGGEKISDKRNYDFSNSDDLKQYFKWMSIERLECPGYGYVNMGIDHNGEPSALFFHDTDGNSTYYDVLGWYVRSNSIVELTVIDEEFRKVGLPLRYYPYMTRAGKLYFPIAGVTLECTNVIL